MKPQSSLLQPIGEKHDNVRIRQGWNCGNCYLGGCDVSAEDGMLLIPGEIIQIELKDAIPTSQFWIDAANNEGQIDFIGNE